MTNKRINALNESTVVQGNDYFVMDRFISAENYITDKILASNALPLIDNLGAESIAGYSADNTAIFTGALTPTIAGAIGATVNPQGVISFSPVADQSVIFKTTAKNAKNPSCKVNFVVPESGRAIDTNFNRTTITPTMNGIKKGPDGYYYAYSSQLVGGKPSICKFDADGNIQSWAIQCVNALNIKDICFDNNYIYAVGGIVAKNNGVKTNVNYTSSSYTITAANHGLNVGDAIVMTYSTGRYVYFVKSITNSNTFVVAIDLAGTQSSAPATGNTYSTVNYVAGLIRISLADGTFSTTATPNILSANLANNFGSYIPNTIQITDSNIFVGGLNTYMANSYVVTKLSLDGTTVISGITATGENNEVKTINYNGTYLAVCGVFATINSATRVNIALLNPSDITVQAFDASDAGANIWDVLFAGSNVIWDNALGLSMRAINNSGSTITLSIGISNKVSRHFSGSYDSVNNKIYVQNASGGYNIERVDTTTLTKDSFNDVLTNSSFLNFYTSTTFTFYDNNSIYVQSGHYVVWSNKTQSSTTLNKISTTAGVVGCNTQSTKWFVKAQVANTSNLITIVNFGSEASTLEQGTSNTNYLQTSSAMTLTPNVTPNKGDTVYIQLTRKGSSDAADTEVGFAWVTSLTVDWS